MLGDREGSNRLSVTVYYGHFSCNGVECHIKHNGPPTLIAIDEWMFKHDESLEPVLQKTPAPERTDRRQGGHGVDELVDGDLANDGDACRMEVVTCVGSYELRSDDDSTVVVDDDVMPSMPAPCASALAV